MNVKPKFNVGDFALYLNKNELVEIKEVLISETTLRKHTRQDGLDGKPTGEETKVVKTLYRISTHTGDTTSVCEELYLVKIPNLYAYKIRRISADEDQMTKSATLELKMLNEVISEYTNMDLVSYDDEDVQALIYEDSTVEYEDSIYYQIVLALRKIMYGV